MEIEKKTRVSLYMALGNVAIIYAILFWLDSTFFELALVAKFVYVIPGIYFLYSGWYIFNTIEMLSMRNDVLEKENEKLRNSINQQS